MTSQANQAQVGTRSTSKFAAQYPRAFRAWQKAAATGQTKLGFAEWRNAQINKMVDSWMIKVA